MGRRRPDVELNILHDGKLVATASVRTIQLQQKDPQDSVLMKKNSDGTESAVEIHFSGKGYAFAVGGEQGQVDGGESTAK